MLDSNRPLNRCSVAVLATVLLVLPATAAEVAGQRRHSDSVPANGGKPLKVFILAGQSNMEGHAQVSTFDYMARDPQTTPILKEMRTQDGTPRVCEKVWISYLTGDGDEYTGRLANSAGDAHH